MLLHLCVDTSGTALCFTLTGDHTLLAESKVEAGRKMNELFIASLDAFLSANACNIKDIAQFTAITGPGSFTGVRIGIAALSGIAEALGTRFTGLSALDAAALLSGKERLSVAAKLKLGEYAVKNYDFTEGCFSKAEVLAESLVPVDSIYINSGLKNTPGFEMLTSAVLSPDCSLFLGKAAPEYIRPSEAELNFDKRSPSE